MNNDNEGGDTTPNTPDNVISLEAFRKNQSDASVKEASPPKPEAGQFEFHFYPSDSGFESEVITASGYLKFGPQFIAILDGPEDFNNVSFTCATNAVKYIKKLGKDKETQGVLSL